MITNIVPSETVRGLARALARDVETKTVRAALADDASVDGWEVLKKSSRTVRLRRRKPTDAAFRDRLWTVMYRMGFSHLSTDNGGALETDEHAAPFTFQVVAADDEVVIGFITRTAERYGKRSQFLAELEAMGAVRQMFARAVQNLFGKDPKRQLVLCAFTEKIAVAEDERARARTLNIQLFDDQDLSYLEMLVSHIGPAARYQFLADLLPGKDVPGLSIRVPAVRTTMGGANCYTFTISPEYLLKIAYVSHRSKGKASDVTTYQRMLAKSRLTKIRQYITNDGIFPTTIVVNLDSKRLRFERVRQEPSLSVDIDSGTLGWLDIKPAYKSAWIIDGQHRLFAYSGHPRAAGSKLCVTAFEGLLPSKQAELFIDINAKQKSVKQSLLQELYAELHWDAENPIVRVRAIVSKAVQDLDADPESALYQRIQTADAAKDRLRCISLTSLYSALEKPGLHIVKERQGHVVEYGPLWAGDNISTLRRTIVILKRWFAAIRNGAPEWWNAGSGEGGGLAMNDGVSTCVTVLRSVVAHLDEGNSKLLHLDSDVLWSALDPFATALGEYFGSLTPEQRKRFRDLRGNFGMAKRTKQCQQALKEKFPEFNPPGLEEFIKLEKEQTNQRAYEVVKRIELKLQSAILEELRREFGPNESQWWMLGVPEGVRKRVREKYEEGKGSRGGTEFYFDLLDYKTIITANWELLKAIFAYGNKKNLGKEQGTAWLEVLNDRRRVIMHPSAAVTLTLEELAELEEYERWLTTQLSGSPEDGDEAS